MNLILQVTSTTPRLPLSELLRQPLGLDVWEVKPDHLVLRAAEPQAERLRRMGYHVEQLQLTATFLSTFATAEAVAGYHSAASLEQDMRELADRQPELVELREIGRSVENRPIWALRIGERRGSPRKLLFLGCHHAREWVAVEVPYRLAEYLVSHADHNPVQQWLSQGELWVAPMVNPDGHEYSRTEDRLWRKNRRPNPDGSVGVDPNRNYGYMWGTLNVSTSSHVPSDETYVGPHAFSEPETRAVRDLIARELFRGVITYHSFSQLILYPWGYTSGPMVDPDDHDRMVTLAQQMQKLIYDVHDTTYTPQRPRNCTRPRGIRPIGLMGSTRFPRLPLNSAHRRSTRADSFFPPTQIQPTWEENQPAALEFIHRIL